MMLLLVMGTLISHACVNTKLDGGSLPMHGPKWGYHVKFQINR